MPRGGTFRGVALLVKKRNSKWSLRNEPKVRFRFLILLKAGPTIRPDLAGTVPVVEGAALFHSSRGGTSPCGALPA